MLYGSITQPAPVVGPSYDVTNRIFLADFLAGTYKIGETTVDPADIFGTGFDPAAVVASGMKTWPATGNLPLLTSAVRSLIFDHLGAGLTFYFELDMAGVNFDVGPLMILSDTADTSYWALGFEMSMYHSTSPAGGAVLIKDQITINDWADGLTDTGTRRIAVSANVPDAGVWKYDAWINGATQIVIGDRAFDILDGVTSIESGFVGAVDATSFYMETSYFRKIAILPPLTGSALVTLSSSGI